MSSCRSTIIQLSPPEPRNLSWSLRVDGSNGIRKDVNHANPGGPFPSPSVTHESCQKEECSSLLPGPSLYVVRPVLVHFDLERSDRLCWRVRASVNLSNTGRLPVYSLSSLLLLASPRPAP